MAMDYRLMALFANAMGQGLMDKDDPMQQVAGVTSKTIATQNYMDMISQMLAGGDSKFSTDGKKFKLDGPSALLRGDEKTPFKGAPAGMAMNAPGGSQGVTPNVGGGGMDFSKLMMMNLLGGGNALNPSASPLDVSGVSLAGLTPENISQALQLKFMSEELERKKLSDFVKMMQPEPTDPRDEPFISNYTLRQFNALTPDYKEYTLAKEGAKTLGDDAFMTKREWEETEPTERQRFLKGLKDKPEMLEMEKKLAEARTTEPKPVKLALMNISTATREVDKRFGSLDATGKWSVTPELQATRTKAQELLADYHKAGMDLHQAVNKSETQARKWKDTIEDSYHARIVAAQQDERLINHINSEFYRQFKYIPITKRSR